ncbi:MAG: autophagy protein 6 [Caeruleum heppii]|nr:MAG: autophagy protein 6 [Caeruleum heppii]
MFCQKCRSPLKVDQSLDDLNPAAFDLLLNSTGHTLHPRPKPSDIVQAPHLRERRELYHQVAQHASQSPISKRTIPAPRLATETSGSGAAVAKSSHAKDNPAMSFVMLTDSQVVAPSKPTPPTTPPAAVRTTTRRGRLRPAEQQTTATAAEKQRPLSQQADTTARLFDILSARSDIDHPICVECTDLLIEGLQKRLTSARKETDAYVGFLKQVTADVPTDEEVQRAEEDLRSTSKHEEAAFAELVKLEEEKSQLDDDIALLEEEARSLNVDEAHFWRDRNAFALVLSSFQSEREGVNLQYAHDSLQLSRLQRTNVYNDTFCIGHDGFFGTINGLRLGRLGGASGNVEWSEINAAWGMALLLLATVAERLGFTFDGYRPRPLGSNSRIEKLEYPSTSSGTSGTSTTTITTPGQAPHRTMTTPKVSVLELYSSGDLPLGRMFIHRRFDAAMVAFLECLRQLGEFVEHPPPPPSHQHSTTPTPTPTPVSGLRLPYDIKKDRIGDASIKLGFNQDEAWTRACKYTLTCCKFLLAHASNVSGVSRRGGEGR